jgi:hypothetical protein
MVFNLASACLTYQRYTTNSTDVYINEPSFGLSITQIVFLSIILYSIYVKGSHEATLLYAIVACFNVAYSAYVIQYHNNVTKVDEFLNNTSLAIIIINSLSICGLCGYAKEKEDEK